ncbi:MAG TPA: hypothetical protein VGN88_12020, partial [Phycisphaerae bacterium]
VFVGFAISRVIIKSMDLTPEQEAYLKKLADPHYYGEQDKNGVDLSLIRENLKLTPLERVRRGSRISKSLREMKARVTRIS